MQVWNKEGATEIPIASGVIRVPNVSAESLIMRNVPKRRTSKCWDGTERLQITLNPSFNESLPHRPAKDLSLLLAVRLLDNPKELVLILHPKDPTWQFGKELLKKNIWNPFGPNLYLDNRGSCVDTNIRYVDQPPVLHDMRKFSDLGRISRRPPNILLERPLLVDFQQEDEQRGGYVVSKGLGDGHTKLHLLDTPPIAVL